MATNQSVPQFPPRPQNAQEWNQTIDETIEALLAFRASMMKWQMAGYPVEGGKTVYDAAIKAGVETIWLAGAIDKSTREDNAA